MNSTVLLSKLRDVIKKRTCNRETPARREGMAVQKACCALLMEVARLDAAGGSQKRDAVAQVMREQFTISEEELATMIASAGRPENRLTSYFRPVKLINKFWGPDEKALFIERLWRVAMADGKIDVYEDQLVRKLADLLYVSHADFILAKRRVQFGSAR